MLKEIKNIFQYRELLFALIVRGIKSKYKNSFLGIFWSLLNPLLNVLIFAFIFSVVIKVDIKNYPLYVLCVIFAWNFFNSTLINSVVSIVEDEHLVKNVCFPIELIPLSVVIVNLVNFLVDLLILILILFAMGVGFKPAWIYLPALIAIELFLICGLSVIFSALYVIFRDINFILNVALRLFFYFVPVVYAVEFVPLSLRRLYLFNPLAVVVDGFAKILYLGRAPDTAWLLLAACESVLIFFFSFVFLRRIKKLLPERL
jgi:lipopolysaccharide transport system permease protein